MEIDPGLLARFEADLAATAGPLAADSRIGVGVSGGADSLALLLLMKAAGRGIHAVTVDHGLRAEARAEADHVAKLCADRKIAHDILGPEPIASGNVQQGARDLRYRLLAEWAEREGITYIVVAHHQDDVAETFLMRASRGAGISGLAAMRASKALSETCTLIRPLLGWSRAELNGIVAAVGVIPVQDPSNEDLHYDRVRMRKLLLEREELPPNRLALSARNLGEANEALDWLADQVWASRVRIGDRQVDFDPEALPAETVRRVTIRALHHVMDAKYPIEGIETLIKSLKSGVSATLAGVKVDPGTSWCFRPAPPRRH